MKEDQETGSLRKDEAWEKLWESLGVSQKKDGACVEENPEGTVYTNHQSEPWKQTSWLFTLWGSLTSSVSLFQSCQEAQWRSLAVALSEVQA